VVIPRMPKADTPQELLVHRSNLLQKQQLASNGTRVQKKLTQSAVAAYKDFDNAINTACTENPTVLSAIPHLTPHINNYIDLAKILEQQDTLFNWRTDFASSILPEALLRLAHAAITAKGISPLFSTRESVVDVTVTGDSIQPLQVRRKNQDFCLGFQKLDLPTGGESVSFIKPALVCEVKTNIDLNKLNGLDFSAQRLKRTFPAAMYFLVTETIDFSLDDNYAAGSIDEMFVLRKQLRSRARRSKEPISADVLGEWLQEVENIALRSQISRAHVYDRMKSGRLINA
jgi:hypothetical protein